MVQSSSFMSVKKDKRYLSVKENSFLSKVIQLEKCERREKEEQVRIQASPEQEKPFIIHFILAKSCVRIKTIFTKFQQINKKLNFYSKKYAHNRNKFKAYTDMPLTKLYL